MASIIEQENAKLGRTSRRQWLSAIASLFGFGFGAVALGRFMRAETPSFTHTVSLGNIDSLVARGKQTTVIAAGTTLVVVRPDSSEPYAMLMQCTHAGCPLALQKNKILCGCHGGVFDIAGRPEAGPPKKPLTRIPLWIEDESVFVRIGGSADA